MNPRFFKTPSDLRAWFTAHHDSATEQWIGFHKKDSGKPSITWPESVDEALCFGWIDGLRKRVDETSYMIRFTPRRPRSIWSAVNIKRANELIEQNLMQPAGLKAFAAREENRSGIYSYEQRTVDLPNPYAKRMKQNQAAWRFFKTQSDYYRKSMNWWILSAKREETRLKRLDRLIERSAQQQQIPEFRTLKKPK